MKEYEGQYKDWFVHRTLMPIVDSQGNCFLGIPIQNGYSLPIVQIRSLEHIAEIAQWFHDQVIYIGEHWEEVGLPLLGEGDKPQTDIPNYIKKDFPEDFRGGLNEQGKD